jgi:hypothetical protein
MDTYLPANGVNADIIQGFSVEDYEIKRLREANANFKLEIIDLKQKIEKITTILSNKNK